jgi:hypothetical protein
MLPCMYGSILIHNVWLACSVVLVSLRSGRPLQEDHADKVNFTISCSPGSFISRPVGHSRTWGFLTIGGRP